MHILPHTTLTIDSSIVWFYVISNALRAFTYIPQIMVVWRSQDGAKSLSLLTWSSWLVANVAAVIYGASVQDAFLVFISLINLTGCGTVTAIVVHRRLALRRLALPRRGPVPATAPMQVVASSAEYLHADFGDTMASAYLDTATLDVESGDRRQPPAEAPHPIGGRGESSTTTGSYAGLLGLRPDARHSPQASALSG